MMPADQAPMRLGFAVKVLGRPDLKSNDARKHQSCERRPNSAAPGQLAWRLNSAAHKRAA